MIPYFTGKIVNGKPKLYQPDLFELYLGQFKEGEEIKYTISRARKGRSNPQNSYLWGCIYPLISEHTGYTTEEVHDAMKYKFLMVEDSPLVRVRSTATLSTVEFEEYLSQIKIWASSELGVYIPGPNDIAPNF